MAAPIGRRAMGVLPRQTDRISLLTFQNVAKLLHPFRYARNTKRRFPVRVMTVEEAKNLKRESHAVKAKRVLIPEIQTSLGHIPNNNYSNTQSETDNMLEDRFTLPDGVRYEKLLEGDPRFGPVVMAAKSRKGREKKRHVLLEGKRLVMDAVDAGAEIKNIYFTRVELLEGLPLADMSADLYKVHMSHMKVWSDVKTPAGIMATCRLPKPGELVQDADEVLPLTLLCDNLRDPGNVGTLLRTAAAVGCHRVIMMKGCVDVWEPKVLRAGAGSHFRLHILTQVGWEMVGNYLSDSAQVFMADCSGHHGEEPGKVPRWLMEKLTSVEQSKFWETDEETQSVQEIDETYLDDGTVKLYKRVPLPVRTYSDVQYTPGEAVVIIGGETEGVSAAAHKLTFERNGDKVYIPMKDGVDSLNSAVAATVVLFEARKQFLQLLEKERGDSCGEQTA